MMRLRRLHPSKIRVRLTLLYAGAFFLAGTVLVALMVLYLAHALDGQLTARLAAAEPVPDIAMPADVQQRLHEQFRQDRDHILATMLVVSLVSLGVVGILAAVFGWLMAGHALRPLQQIAATARRVVDRSLHERIGLTGPDDEVKDLADTVDAMLERLDRSFDSQRRFVANASHELRTPLTLHRTLIEVTLEDPAATDQIRQLGTTLLAISQRQERLIDGLLTLASSEQTLTQQEQVDLAGIARHLADENRAAASAAGIDLRTDLHAAWVTGDPVLLERLTHNLLDNALRYNLPDHGDITITTRTAGGHAVLTVANTGPAVPAYEIPTLFQPFRRLLTPETRADARAGAAAPAIHRGAGLGLSIVAAVAHAHHGEVQATPNDTGGLTVQVRVPTSDQR